MSDQDPAAEAQAREIIDQINGLVGRVWAHFTARAAEVGLSVPEAKALQAVEIDQDVPMRTIAARLHANPSNVTVVISRLEARGLISRTAGADRRVKGVRLTASGQALRDRLDDRLAAEHPALNGLSANQRESLLRLLRRLGQYAG